MKRLFGILLISIQIQLLGQQDLVSLEVVPQEVVDTPPHPDVVGKYWLVSKYQKLMLRKDFLDVKIVMLMQTINVY